MTKHELIVELIGQGALKTRSIISAFRKIDRAKFVLEQYQDQAYENYPLPIGFNQTISQPYTVAFMLELLQPKAGEKILDIGSGSGWVTALLCFLAGDMGKVVGVERILELKKMAEKNLSKYPMYYRTSTVVHIDGSKGFPKEAPFDKIIAAAAAKEIPQEWKQQLKVGGRIVAPVADSIIVVDRIAEREFATKQHWGFAFVPLIKD